MNTQRLIGRAAARLVLVGTCLACGGAGLAACGGAESSSQPAQTPAAAAATLAPKEAAGIAVLLLPSSIPSVTSATQGALVQAGYNIVVDLKAPHDAIGKLTVSAVEIPSLFQVQLNGVRQTKHRLTVSLAIVVEDRVIDQVSSEFESSNQQVSANQLSGLVSALNASRGFKKFAVEHAAAAKQKEDEVVAQKEADDQKAAAAETEWEGLVGECRQPKALTSCDALKAWLARSGARVQMLAQQGGSRDSNTVGRRKPRPGDPDEQKRRDALAATRDQEQKKLVERREEARQVIDAAAPALRELAEAAAFDKLDLHGCAAGTDPSLREATQFLRTYPKSKHADEVTKCVADGDKKVTARLEQEQRRSDAEAAAGAHRQRQANCKSDCPAKCVAFTKDEARTKCMEQCAGACN